MKELIVRFIHVIFELYSFESCNGKARGFVKFEAIKSSLFLKIVLACKITELSSLQTNNGSFKISS
jgi:hypothetical protein